ncbi:MAG: hypothetical protein ACUVTZ_11440, partial [Armatimonadota bacterium]
MKRTLGLVVMGLLLAVVPAVAQTVTVGEYTANPGDTVRVDVRVDAAVRGVAGAQIVLDFKTVTPAGSPGLTADPAGLIYGVIPAGGLMQANVAVPGQLSVAIAAISGGDGPGVLLSVPIKVPEDAVPGAVYQLNLTTAELSDINGDVIQTTSVGGSITIATGEKGKVSVGEYKGKAGEVVTVEIKVTEAVKRVAGAQLLLKFGDIGAVDEAGVAYGVIPAGALIQVNATKPGELNAAIASVSGGNGPGTLLTVPIRLKDDLPAGKYPVTLEIAELNDENGDVIPTETVQGSIAVAPTVELKVASVEATPGRVANLVVQLTTPGIPVAGAQVTLKFGDIGGVVKDAVSYGVIPAGGVLVVDTTTPGQVTVSVMATSAAAGPGNLFTIPVRLRADLPEGEYPIEIISAPITGEAGEAIDAVLVSGVLRVLPGPPAALVTAGIYEGVPGGLVNIEIKVDGKAVGVAGAQVLLRFGDIGSVVKDRVRYGVVPAGGVLAVNTDVPGEVNLAVASPAGGNGPGTLFTVPLRLRPDVAVGTYPLKIALANLTNEAGDSLPLSPVDGELAVRPAPEAALWVTAEPARAVPGQTVKLLVNVNDKVLDVTSARVSLNFGPLGTVQKDAVTYGVIPPGGLVAVDTATPGEVTVGVVGVRGGSGPGTLLTIPITIARGLVPGEYPVTVVLASLTSETGAEIPVVVTSGKVVVATPGFLLGDVNGDGKVDLTDLQLAIQLYFEGPAAD